jgi:hypothetical protein
LSDFVPKRNLLHNRKLENGGRASKVGKGKLATLVGYWESLLKANPTLWGKPKAFEERFFFQMMVSRDWDRECFSTPFVDLANYFTFPIIK